MKHLKYAEIKLRTSELTTFMKSVPVWELPIIELVHGKAAIESVVECLRDTVRRKRNRDGSIVNVENIPTGAGEYARLAKRYGKSQTEDGGVGPAYVDLIYGQFGVGETHLQREIDRATVELAPGDVSDLTGEQVSSVGG